MGSQRLTRINELIQHELASALYRVMPEADFDLAAVTVTHVMISSDLHHARVLVSVRGPAEKQARTLAQLNRHRAELQAVLHRNVILKYTPKLSFALDGSIAEGDRILHLITELEQSAGAGADAAPPPAAATDEP